ncbi:MAG: response regulator transcription factor [Gemmatimonadota bacterium]|nr:response regulator transcription factor [Gemmatimonadota bacterium]
MSNGRRGRTVLVVEDDDDLLSVLERILAAEGYRVRTALDGEAGLTIALDADPDLVIADIGLPGRDGMAMTRELRRRGFRAPVLMLTARSAVSDRVSGLDAGADDYLPKPFEMTELVARVKALLRRATLTARSAMLQVRDVTLDPMTRRVERAKEPVELTQTEYALLEYLMRNADRPVAREQLAQHVWHRPMDSGTNLVDVYVNYLRHKLGDDKDRPLIRTLRGVGYVMQTRAGAGAKTGQG